MDEVLFGVLAENVGTYLDGIDRHGRVEELRRLVAAWRAILDIHRPGGRHGRCQGCGPPARGPFGRGNDGMCGVWRVANAFFVRDARGPLA